MTDPSLAELIEASLDAATREKCDHCGATGADFFHLNHRFCCECMSALTSWYLDGGMVEDPEQFAYVLGVERADGR